MNHDITLGEEEISDISLATFMSSTKKIPEYPGPTYKLPTIAAAEAAEAAEAARCAEAAG